MQQTNDAQTINATILMSNDDYVKYHTEKRHLNLTFKAPQTSRERRHMMVPVFICTFEDLDKYYINKMYEESLNQPKVIRIKI
jgi:hypothetical protein